MFALIKILRRRSAVAVDQSAARQKRKEKVSPNTNLTIYSLLFVVGKYFYKILKYLF
jgi:hypothetical protein